MNIKVIGSKAKNKAQEFLYIQTVINMKVILNLIKGTEKAVIFAKMHHNLIVIGGKDLKIY